jgi:hypothetical protein
MTEIFVDGPVPISQPRKKHLCKVWLSSVQGVTGTNIDRVNNLLLYSSQVVIKETSNDA